MTDLNEPRQEKLRRITGRDPGLLKAVNDWADRCFHPHWDDALDVCEKHREEAPPRDCAECRVPLNDTADTRCEICQWFRDYYAENGREICGRRRTLTDRANSNSPAAPR